KPEKHAAIGIENETFYCPHFLFVLRFSLRRDLNFFPCVCKNKKIKTEQNNRLKPKNHKNTSFAFCRQGKKHKSAFHACVSEFFVFNCLFFTLNNKKEM
ncbi:hypothetical protein M5D96_011036, partial [Drosophila gunungcola]